MSAELVLSGAIFIGLALLIPTIMVLTAVLGPRSGGEAKNAPYESGIEQVVGMADQKFSVKFYLLAILFLIFLINENSFQEVILEIPGEEKFEKDIDYFLKGDNHIDYLTNRDKKILTLRNKGLKHQEIADNVGLARSRVSQILKKIDNVNC